MKNDSIPTSGSDMTAVDQTLNTRGETYGDFSLGIELEAVIIKAIMENYSRHNLAEMPMQYVLMISKIVMKLSRLSVTPTHLDSVHDIQGYGKLWEDYLIKNGDKNA